MNTKGTLTVPLLPCASLEETLDFWQALGFEVPFKQRAPNAYAIIRDADYELHFFDLKQLKPEDNFSTCLVVMDEIESVHRGFVERLRAALGKIPLKGFPRITRMKPGQSRFTLTDIAGNSIIFIKRGAEDADAADAYKQAGQTPLQQALSLAGRLRDFKGDDADAAKVLDRALARPDQQGSLDYARALAARIELAAALEEPAHARDLLAQFHGLALSDGDRQTLWVEITALGELERALP